MYKIDLVKYLELAESKYRSLYQEQKLDTSKKDPALVSSLKIHTVVVVEIKVEVKDEDIVNEEDESLTEE